jgi:hypothetical protein
MGMLFFVCPTSGLEVSSGIEIDPESYSELPKGLSEILCPRMPSKTRPIRGCGLPKGRVRWAIC